MKKGFTLVETMAVVSVIVLIGLITVPAISKNLESNQRKIFKETVEQIVESVKIYRAENGITADHTYNIKTDNNIEYAKKSKIKGGTVEVSGSTYQIVNINNGDYCANGTLDNLEIEEVDDEGECK